MSLIQSGKTFNDGEQLTAGKLNQMFSDASISTTGVDGTSIIVNANDALAVRSINSSRIDSGAVITDKLPNSTVTATDGTPDGVTFPKIQHIETDKILGRTTTGDGIVETIGLNTDNAMASASATTLATDGSIKDYVDNSNPSPSRVYNNLAHSTDSGTTQKNETGRPLWVSFTLLRNQGGINYILGEISPNDDMSAPNTRIGQGRVISQSGNSSATQVTMIVPAGYSWKFSFSPSTTTERVHSSFIL